MKTNKLSRRKAFTLIELLIVIAIIGILFIVLVSKVDFATDKAKATGVQTDFRSFQVAFETVARENSGFATFGWDTGDTNGDRVRNSYDAGDTNKDGVKDDDEVWTGHKVYTETWTGIYTLTNPADSTDTSAIVALETAINKNLDPKLQITIHDNLTITMANQATDPWKNEYHGRYLSNATNDGKDRGVIFMYSDGANGDNGSADGIAGGKVNITTPGNNVAGKDDYAIGTVYTYMNGYGEVMTVTKGFGNDTVFPSETEVPTTPTDPGDGSQPGGNENPGGNGETPDGGADNGGHGGGTTGGETGGETGGGSTGGGTETPGNTSSFSQDPILYTWAELNEMAMENLTAEQYKTQYGIEVGMIKDDKYVLVDLDGNGYDGFIFMYDMGITMALDDYRSNTGAYPSFPTSEFIKDSFLEMPYEIRRITKTITAKINESTASIDTVYNYTCQLILPSAREISNTVSTWEPDTIPLDREGQTFEFFALYGAEARRAISNTNHWWTRSCNYDIYSVYSVQPDGGVGASYPTGVYELHPFFVIGRPADPEIPETTVEDYTWAQLKALGAQQLTADQYKFEYGIQVGQVKDDKYVLVDVNNSYGGFVFMFNTGLTHAYSTVGTISGGYSNAYYLNTINSQVLATMTESDEDGTLKAALKTVDVKHTGGYGDYWEDHIYTTQIFAPAVREIYSGLAGAANKYTYVCDDTYYPYVIQEGQTFEWFLVDDHTTEYQKRAAFSLTSQNFWTRTTYMKNNRTDSFCSIQSDGGVGASMASGVNQIVMCFVIG